MGKRAHHYYRDEQVWDALGETPAAETPQTIEAALAWAAAVEAQQRSDRQVAALVIELALLICDDPEASDRDWLHMLAARPGVKLHEAGRIVLLARLEAAFAVA